MKKYTSHGSAFIEYGIILGLIALLSLPVLIYLGATQQHALNTDAAVMENNDNLALIAPKHGQKSEGITGPASSGNQTVPLMQNPGTGQLSLSSIQSGGGSQTTSVEGTTMSSRNLMNIANNWTDPSTGQPLPSNIKDLILHLAQEGQTMAGTENSYIQDPSKKDIKSLSRQTVAFGNDYAQLQSVLANPQYAALKSAIYNNAYQIYNLSTQNFGLNNWGNKGSSARNISTLNQQVFNQTPGGTFATNATASQTPQITTTDSNNIQSTSE